MPRCAPGTLHTLSHLIPPIALAISYCLYPHFPDKNAKTGAQNPVILSSAIRGRKGRDTPMSQVEHGGAERGGGLELGPARESPSGMHRGGPAAVPRALQARAARPSLCAHRGSCWLRDLPCAGLGRLSAHEAHPVVRSMSTLWANTEMLLEDQGACSAE